MREEKRDGKNNRFSILIDQAKDDEGLIRILAEGIERKNEYLKIYLRDNNFLTMGI